MEKEVFLVV